VYCIVLYTRHRHTGMHTYSAYLSSIAERGCWQRDKPDLTLCVGSVWGYKYVTVCWTRMYRAAFYFRLDLCYWNCQICVHRALCIFGVDRVKNRSLHLFAQTDAVKSINNLKQIKRSITKSLKCSRIVGSIKTAQKRSPNDIVWSIDDHFVKRCCTCWMRIMSCISGAIT